MSSEVFNEQGVVAEIECITDEKICKLWSDATLALVINKELKVKGKLSIKPTLASWIKQAVE